MASIAWTTIKHAIATWILQATGLTADRIRWAGQNAPVPPTSATLPWILIGRFTWTGPGTDWNTYAPRVYTIADLSITLDGTTDLGTTPAAHNLETRDGPFQFTTTGSLAGTGLAVATDYWVIKTGTNTLKFATTFPNADAGTFIDLTDAGTGTHKLVSTSSTRKAGQELTEYVRGARRVSFTIQCFPPQPALGTPIPDDSDPVAVLSEISSKVYLGSIYSGLEAANIGILDTGEPQAVDGVFNNVLFEPRATMTVVFATTSEVSGTEGLFDYVNIYQEDGPHDFPVDTTVPPNKP